MFWFKLLLPLIEIVWYKYNYHSSFVRNASECRKCSGHKKIYTAYIHQVRDSNFRFHCIIQSINELDGGLAVIVFLSFFFISKCILLNWRSMAHTVHLLWFQSRLVSDTIATKELILMSKWRQQGTKHTSLWFLSCNGYISWRHLNYNSRGESNTTDVMLPSNQNEMLP